MRALALSGGGNRGALQAGAAGVLIAAGPAPDVIAGRVQGSGSGVSGVRPR